MIELLSGVRVIECAMLFNGDQTGRTLGDLGADVIKVETPGVGDYLRDFLGQITPHNSLSHLYANRNKRSITLNLKSDEGRDLFFRLLQSADIFVDGFAGDACDRLGIGYEAQRKAKPDIIYAQCSGFGAAGPAAGVPTHGQMMGSLGGGAVLELRPDGFVKENGGLTDGTVVGAMATALTAVAALQRRERTGEGCYIDGAGSDAVLANEWYRATYHWNDAKITDRSGMFDPTRLNPKYAFYATEDDKFVIFCAIEPKFWTNFCQAIDRTDLLSSHDSSAPVDYMTGGDALADTLKTIFGGRTQREWTELAIRHDIPLGPANQVADLQSDPQLNARGMIVESTHPEAGKFLSVGWPALVSDQPFEIYRPAPALGQDQAEILAELGIDSDEVDRLAERAVI